jgi:thiosulfate dehydrogenase [quinone] large subunit
MEGYRMSTTPTAPAGAAAPIAVAPKLRAKTVSITREGALRYVWAATRLGLGWIFLWAFLDKTFGLSHETASADSWLNGGSPTEGFLGGSVGPFSSIYHSIAGSGLVDGLFMVGLAAVGVLLLLGIAMRFACGAGALMVVLMWTASLPPENNLFLDDHIIYALVLGGLALAGAGNTLGLGRRWTRSSLVQRFPWLA